jgi:heme exporter protein CcmD
MGEYAIFIWPCYIAVVVLLAGLGYSSWIAKRKATRKLDDLKHRIDQLDSQE